MINQKGGLTASLYFFLDMIINKVFRDLEVARYHLANARKNLIQLSDFGAREVHEMIQKIDKLKKKRTYEGMDDSQRVR